MLLVIILKIDGNLKVFGKCSRKQLSGLRTSVPIILLKGLCNHINGDLFSNHGNTNISYT